MADPAPAQQPPRDGAATGHVAVGRINSTWGLRGHVRVTPLTANPQRFVPGAVLFVRGEPRRILDVRTPQGYPIVQFEGYTERDAAATLRGALIEIDADDLPELADGEYYLHDLVGLAVETAAGAPVGRLVEVLRTGANDVYLVRPEQGRDVLIPATAEVVIEVDVPGGRLVIEPLPGLLDV